MLKAELQAGEKVALSLLHGFNAHFVLHDVQGELPYSSLLQQLALSPHSQDLGRTSASLHTRQHHWSCTVHHDIGQQNGAASGDLSYKEKEALVHLLPILFG